LPIDQYKALLKAIPEVNAALKKAGVDVEESAELEDDLSKAAPKSKINRKPGKEKSNIEETSDEDDEE
jgi:hypothetical protein